MIEKIFDIIGIISRDKGVNVTVEELNILANKANIDLYRNLFGFLKTGKKEEISKDITHALARFKTAVDLEFVGGVAQLPDDYYTYARFEYLYRGQYHRVIDFVTSKEAEESFASFIVNPTELFPKIEIIGNQLFIYPSIINNVKLVYYRYPREVRYIERIENEINVFDDINSVDYEYPEIYMIDLLRLILSYLGLQINDAGLIQYMESKKQTEL